MVAVPLYHFLPSFSIFSHAFLGEHNVHIIEELAIINDFLITIGKRPMDDQLAAFEASLQVVDHEDHHIVVDD